MQLSLHDKIFGVGFDETLRTFPEPPAMRLYVRFCGHTMSGHGKMRKLEVPNKAMREVHIRLLRFLRTLPSESSYATGCKPGDSPAKNVKRHAGQCFFYLVDLRGAFHSVDIPVLAGILRKAAKLPSRQESQILALLERYCASHFGVGGLAEGVPASSDLFDLYCAVRIDKQLGPYCKWWGIRYTRYADDLVFSSERPLSRKIRQYIRRILEEAGFAISHHKCELRDLKKGPIKINGIGLQPDGRMFVPRPFTRRTQHLLHLVLEKGRWELLPQVQGRMALYRQLTEVRNPNRTEKHLLEQYAALQRILRKEKMRAREQKKRVRQSGRPEYLHVSRSPIAC